MLEKFVGDPESIILIEGLGVQENLSYKEVPIEILNRQVRSLRNREVASVKVLWRKHLVGGVTCQGEAKMKSRYPHLFGN